jgi:ribosome-binding protein aMBF1 (putative translation factor)
MASPESLNVKPVFLSDASGQPAWAVLPYDEYQALLNAAGLSASLGEDVNPAATPSASTDVPANATAQLLASLVENSQTNADDGVFDAEKFRAKVQASPLSLEDLARSAGISPSYIAMIVSGEREPSGPVVHSLARALSIAPGELNSAV